MRASHEVWFSFSYRVVADGALLQVFIKANEDAADQDLIAYVNSMNQQALLSRYLIDADGDVACEAWYPGPYDKDGFDRFMEAWHHDLAVLAQNEQSSKMLS